MKKSLLVISILFLGFLSKAEFISHCTIFAENGEKFTVYLNGEKKNEEPDQRVRMINLTQSYYAIKIVFQDTGIANIERSLFHVHDAHGSPVDVTYILKKNKKGMVSLYWKSQTTFPEYIETNRPTVVIVNGGNQVVQQTTTTTTEPDRMKLNFATPGGSVSINTGSSSAETTTTQQTTTTVVSGTAVASGSAAPCTGTLLSESDYASALKSIQARSTVEGKILSAKQIVASNCLNVVQVKSILKLFDTDQAKLEIAKYAYANTIDKGNFYKLNDVFVNESSIDELTKAIIK